jgi:endogenous inhibitor of DNA gyrase (YacG/DUF329 family)
VPYHTCPICRKRFSYESVESCTHFPFCSDRCKLIDLGRWFDGDYVIPGSDEEDRSDEEQEEEK